MPALNKANPKDGDQEQVQTGYAALRLRLRLSPGPPSAFSSARKRVWNISYKFDPIEIFGAGHPLAEERRGPESVPGRPGNTVRASDRRRTGRHHREASLMPQATAHETAPPRSTGAGQSSIQGAARCARFRRDSVRRSRVNSTHPAMPAEAVSPATPQAARSPPTAVATARRYNRATRGQRHPDDREPQRRARVAQGIVGGRDRDASVEASSPTAAPARIPHTDGVRMPEPAGLESRAATTSPSARNATADGTTKKAIRRRPSPSRCRSACGRAGVLAAQRPTSPAAPRPTPTCRTGSPAACRASVRWPAPVTAPVGRRLASSVST